MNYTIYPRPLSGVINAPSSKSIMHRVLICASFSHGNTIIESPLYCYDTLMTMKALENIGVTFKKDDNKLIVYPPKPLVNTMLLNSSQAMTHTCQSRLLLPVLNAITAMAREKLSC